MLQKLDEIPVHSNPPNDGKSNMGNANIEEIKKDIHEGSGTGIMSVHGESMTAGSFMDITGTWCNQFCKEQLKATLKNF